MAEANEVIFKGSNGYELSWVSTDGHTIIWSNGETFSYTPSNFPPTSTTTLTKTIPSYLYVEYNDDDDLQAFVAAQNEEQQDYADWFVNANLPLYTQQTGPLLDWVAEGLYGSTRPVLPTGLTNQIGPLNTFVTDTLVYNGLTRATYTNFFVTTDDTFQRILTWNFYKGDGFQFTIPWLKRRVMRFLYGPNGVPFNVDETYSVGVSFPTASHCHINISHTTYPSPAAGPLLQSAVQSGAVNLPFQYTFTVVL